MNTQLLTLNEKQIQLSSKLSRLKDRPDDLYTYLIDLAKKLPAMEPSLKSDEHLVPGCVSKVWLCGTQTNGRMFFIADGDAQIPKGIISLVLGLVQDQPPQDILSFDFSFLEELGLGASLSFNRRNSVSHFIKKIKEISLKNS